MVLGQEDYLPVRVGNLERGKSEQLPEQRSGRKGKARGGSMSKLTWIARLYKQSWIKTYQKD